MAPQTDTTTQPTVLMAPPDMSEVPSLAEIFDALHDAGHTAQNIRVILDMMQSAAKQLKAPEGEETWIDVDMSAHELLDDIMPDKATAAPGSIHERLDRRFLPEGYTFLHDVHGHCSLEAVRKN